MLTAKIQSVEKSSIVQTGEEFLDVTIGLYEDEKLVETRKLGYPVDTSKKEIMDEAKKILKTYKQEKTQMAEQKEVDAQNAKAQKTIDSLEGEEISIK